MHELKFEMDLGQVTWKPQYVGKATLTLPHYNFVPLSEGFRNETLRPEHSEQKKSIVDRHDCEKY